MPGTASRNLLAAPSGPRCTSATIILAPRARKDATSSRPAATGSAAVRFQLFQSAASSGWAPTTPKMPTGIPATVTMRSRGKSARPRASSRLEATAGTCAASSSSFRRAGPIARSRSAGSSAASPMRAYELKSKRARRTTSPPSGGRLPGSWNRSGSSRSPASTTSTPSASVRARSIAVARRAVPPSGCAAHPQFSYSPCRSAAYISAICVPRWAMVSAGMSATDGVGDGVVEGAASVRGAGCGGR